MRAPLKRFLAGMAVALAALTLGGCAGPADSGTTDQGAPAYHRTFWQTLPDGQKVLCIWAQSGDGGGLSCDWAGAGQPK